MNGIRWIILIVGILVVVGIYLGSLYSKKKNNSLQDFDHFDEEDPVFDDWQDDVLVKPITKRESVDPKNQRDEAIVGNNPAEQVNSNSSSHAQSQSDTKFTENTAEEWVDDVRPIRSKNQTETQTNLDDEYSISKYKNESPQNDFQWKRPASLGKHVGISKSKEYSPDPLKSNFPHKSEDRIAENLTTSQTHPIMSDHDSSDDEKLFETQGAQRAPTEDDASEFLTDDLRVIGQNSGFKGLIPRWLKLRKNESDARESLMSSQDIEEKSIQVKMEDILVMHLEAPVGEVFVGEALKNAFVRCQLTFGELNIFHYQNENHDILFSVANMINPGVFNLNAMDELETPGISLFMNMRNLQEPMTAFRKFLEISHCLVQNIGGKLMDENHNQVTKQTLTHYEERVREFIRMTNLRSKYQ